MNSSTIKTKKSNSQTREENRQKIADCIQNMVMRGTDVTQEGIAEETKLSRKCVNEHFNKYDEKKVKKNTVQILKMLQPKIAMKVSNLALNGNPKGIKMYHEIIGSPKKEQKINNNFITIQNNNLLINVPKDKLQTMPPEMRMHLTHIVKFLSPDNVINNPETLLLLEGLHKGLQKTANNSAI